MATVTKGKTFVSGETVTPPKLNDLVDNATVTNIATADISDSAITTAKINDAAVTFAKQESPQYTGYRNAIINGNFDIWQRGTSHTANGYGSADRWINGRAGSTCTLSREAFTLGQNDVPNEPTYFCRMSVVSSAGSTNFVVLAQPIEDPRTFAGQAVTVSFYAKADAARPISVELVQYFGTGGSPSAEVNALGVTKTTLSTSWQKITVTTTLPSINGKTLGTDNNGTLSLNIWLDAGSDFNARTDTLGQQSGTFDIAQVQIEAGPVATPFERRPIGTELALCQRYYQIGGVGLSDTFPSTGGNLGGIAVATATTFAIAGVQFPTTMRARPTLRVADIAGTIGNVRNVTRASNQTFTTTDHDQTCIKNFAFSGGQIAADVYAFQWEASAEL
jgi:hypothetical protein